MSKTNESLLKRRQAAVQQVGAERMQDAAGDRPHPLANLVAQARAFLIVGGPAMHQHGGRFLAAGGSDRESRDIALLEAGNRFVVFGTRQIGCGCVSVGKSE